jgi:hypothetical protein
MAATGCRNRASSSVARMARSYLDAMRGRPAPDGFTRRYAPPLAIRSKLSRPIGASRHVNAARRDGSHGVFR